MSSTRPVRYRQIAEHLRRQIETGVYRAGDRLPTEMDLARLFGVSRVTSAAALAALAREGLVERAPRRGTTVRARTPVGRSGAPSLIAWIQPDIDYSFGLQLLRGMEHAARAAGYHLLFHLTGNSREEEEIAIRAALAAGARGIALYLQDGETYNAEVLRLVLDGFPVVLVDRYLRGVRCATAGSDNIAGARAAVEELLGAGHRHICALAYPVKGTSTIEDRLEGYAQALTASGISVDRSLIYTEERLRDLPEPWRLPSELIDRLAAYLRAHPRITALFGTNAGVALLGLRAAEQLGLQVPRDLSIICIDALETFPIPVSAITCMLQEGFAIGSAAMELLREGLAEKPPRRVALPMCLERHGSIAPPSTRAPAAEAQRLG